MVRSTVKPFLTDSRLWTVSAPPACRLSDSVEVLHTTLYKIGHFRDALPSQSLVLKKQNQNQEKQPQNIQQT